MNISVKGKHVDIGEALRAHAEDALKATVSKYFDKALDSNVVVSRDGHLFRADISVHAGRGMVMQGHASADDAYAAFDGALERIAKQLRRYKSRLQDHHKDRGEENILRAQYSVIDAGKEDEEAPEAHAAIIAEMPHDISTLTVGEAVMRLDLAGSPVIMFHNSAHGGLNVVYRRIDGNVGWIDPSDSQEG